jgi:glycosyltransferase involved in cell wall biosynthesis
LFPLAVEQHDLRGYDVVISSSHLVSKGAITAPDQPHICYCHSPVRYGWDLYHQYLEEANLTKGLKATIVKYLLHRLRSWDALTAHRPDFFIANSHYIAKRMQKVWRAEAKVIYPPVDTERFKIAEKPDEYFFTAGRFVPYKKIDLIVKAFKQLPHLKLIVCGDGPQARQIKEVAGKNVEIISHASEADFASYMSNAKAFLYAAEEDFGIILAEAQAAGVPVIAFGKGGAAEIIEHLDTGILYPEQTSDSLVTAINNFEKNRVTCSASVISEKAERFSADRFVTEYQHYVQQCYLAYTQGK